MAGASSLRGMCRCPGCGGSVPLRTAVDAPEPAGAYGVVAAGHLADAASEPELSDAERIARLQRTLDSDQKHRRRIASRAGQSGKGIPAGRQPNSNNSTVSSKPHGAIGTAALAELQAKWDLAKQRFELAIREKQSPAGVDRHARNQNGARSDLIDKLLKTDCRRSCRRRAEHRRRTPTGDSAGSPADPRRRRSAPGITGPGGQRHGRRPAAVPPGSVPTLAGEPNLGRPCRRCLPSEAEQGTVGRGERDEERERRGASRPQVAAAIGHRAGRNSRSQHRAGTARCWKRPREGGQHRSDRRQPGGRVQQAAPGRRRRPAALAGLHGQLGRRQEPASARPRPKSDSTRVSSTNCSRSWRRARRANRGLERSRTSAGSKPRTPSNI